MNPELEAIQKSIVDLATAVKENGGTNGLDMESMKATVEKAMEDQRKLFLDNQPVRMGEFQSDPVQQAASAYRGKYAPEVRAIAKQGEYRIGGYRLKGTDLVMAKTLIDQANKIKANGIDFPNADKLKPASEDLNNAVKALDATTGSAGDEYVPTGMASELWQDFFTASRIASDLPTIQMPTDPYDDPLDFSRVTFKKGTPNTAITAQTPTTAKSTLTATEMIAEVDWAYDFDEDAVIAAMPNLRRSLTEAGAETMDAFCLNADATDAATGNINLHDADPDADSYYLTKGQDGMRHQAMIDHTDQKVDVAAAIDDAHMVETLALLGKYAIDLNNMRIVPGVEAYIAMLGLTNVATFDKFGSLATILNGELLKYRGIPVIPSASMALTDTDGYPVNTAATNVKKAILFYNRNMWRVGFRRGLTIEVDRSIQKRQLIMVVSFRIAVGCWGTRSSNTHTAEAYDIT